MSGKTKPKIALLHYSGPPVIAGVEQAILNYARHFRYFNYQVEVVVGSGRQWRKDIPVKVIPYLSPRSRPIYRLNLKLNKGILPDDFAKIEEKIFNDLKKYIADSGIKVLIVHNVMTRHYNLALTAALARLAKELPQVRFISWIHDLSFADTGYIDLPKKLRTVYPWSLIASPAKNFRYVAISEARAAEFRGIAQAKVKIDVVPNAIDPKKFFQLQPQVRKLVNQLGIQNLDYVGILPVRAVERKNIELALSVIQEMIKMGKQVRFLITAPMNYQQKNAGRDYLQLLQKTATQLGIAKSIIFLSKYRLPNGKLIDLAKLPIEQLFVIADFLLIPSKIEGFGMPLIEAGIARVSIFASDIAPFREIGKNDISYFSLSDKPAKIAKTVIDTLEENPTSRLYHRVMHDYSFITIFEKHVLPLVS
ncbi:MAG: glycosyltransferase family 4 protein [Patescibacteria group bacterium]